MGKKIFPSIFWGSLILVGILLGTLKGKDSSKEEIVSVFVS